MTSQKDAREVGAALERILATSAFARSPRLAEFLRFVVEQHLAGRASSPKEFEIGVQVFGRPSDYYCRIDPVVRVQARLLRFKLHEYYETVGKNDPLRIELPKGSYLASFSAKTIREPAPAAPVRRSIQLRWVIAAVAIAAAFATILVSWDAWKEAAGKVWAKTLPAQPTSAQSAAAQLYLKGRYYWSKRTPEDLSKAVDYFTQSIVADPGYAKAYAGLADTYGLLREFAAMPDSEAWPRALAAARKAVELDDSLAEAHSSLGFSMFYVSLDLKGGEREFRRAVELNPNYSEAHHWYGTALMTLGRFTEASEELARARELGPASRSILADQGLLLFYAGKRAQAIEQLQEIEAAEPSFRSAHLYLSCIYFDSQDAPGYLMEARKAAESSHDLVELAIVKEAERGFASAGQQGMLQHLLNIQKRFNAEGRYPAFHVAETSALMGNKDEALEYLQSSYDKRELYIAGVSITPAFADLRGEPRYRRLLAQLGLDVPN